MPDILINCPECSREYKVSEYATVDGMTCVTCGAGLVRPELQTENGAGLRLQRNMTKAVPPPLAPVVAAGELATSSGPTVYAAPAVNVHNEEEVKAPPRWLPYVVAFAVIGALIGFQYFSKQLDSYLTYYIWTRNILGGAAYLLVVLLAFQDHLGQGALSLVVPPYAFFYTASSVESGVLRGLFFGMVIVVMSETYFLPDNSIMVALGGQVSEVIKNVDGLILHASDSPI